MTHLTRPLHPMIAALDEPYARVQSNYPLGRPTNLNRQLATDPEFEAWRRAYAERSAFEQGDHCIVTLLNGARSIVREGDCRQPKEAPASEDISGNSATSLAYERVMMTLMTAPVGYAKPEPEAQADAEG